MCRDKHNSAVQWTEERLRAKSTKGASCRSDPNAVQSDNPLLIHAELNAEKGQVREELLNRNEGNGMNVWMNAYCGRVTEVGKTKRRQSTFVNRQAWFYQGGALRGRGRLRGRTKCCTCHPARKRKTTSKTRTRRYPVRTVVHAVEVRTLTFLGGWHAPPWCGGVGKGRLFRTGANKRNTKGSVGSHSRETARGRHSSPVGASDTLSGHLYK